MSSPPSSLPLERQLIPEQQAEKDPWAHAGSIENERMLEDKRAELAHMRYLFEKCLPVGKQREHITDYFNELEKLIYTTDVKNDEFNDDDSTNPQREYQYFSASVLKERASQPQIFANPSHMEHSNDNINDVGDKLSSKDIEHGDV